MSDKPYPWEKVGETLVLETPEQVKIEYQLAPFGSRIVAALLDRLIVTGTLIGILVPVTLLGEADSGYIVGAAIVGYFLISTFYFVWSESKGEGRTVGKRRTRLRTVSQYGRGPSPGASLIRNIARIADEIPLFWILPMVTFGRRRIGDFLAGTFVIDESGPEPAKKSRLQSISKTYADLEDRRFILPTTAATQLFPDDLSLLDYMDQRLAGSTRRDRKKTYTAVAEKYLNRLELEDQADAIREDPERFLSELSLYLKDRFEGRIE